MTAPLRAAAAACALALALAACQPDGADPRGAQDPDTVTPDVLADNACVTRWAGGNEISSVGELVQLDVTFRLQANRSGSVGAGDTSMRLEAESLVEGTSSQLACLWKQRNGSPDKIDLKRREGAPFPRLAQGSAMLAGVRTMQGEAMTAQEEVDVSGPLEILAVQGIDVRDTQESPACVHLAFEAPLQGRSVRIVTAPGIRQEEKINPSDLVLDGYSVLSPGSFGADDHRFLDHSFSICTGEAVQGPTAGADVPRGLSISPDGRLWQRNGVWRNHASGPAETRVIDFSMRVVPPRAELRASL